MELSQDAKREHQQPSRVIERLRAADEMFEFGCAMMRQNLARRFPTLSAEGREQLFLRWLRKEPLEDGASDEEGR